MGLFSRMLKTSDLRSPQEWFMKALGVSKSKSGIDVDEFRAMQSTAVLACVKILAETIASLPFPVYRRIMPRGKERASSHSLYRLLQTKPNPEMTSFLWRETTMCHVLLWGNAYSEIEIDRFGDIKALWPLPPYRVTPMRTDKGELFYRATMPDGTMKNIPSYRMFHLPGLGYNGVTGMSVVSWGREAIGLGLATEQFGAEFFSNGTNVGAVVTHPNVLSDKAWEHLQKSLQEKYEGLGKSHKLMLLEEGMTFAKNTIQPNDAQFLETRKFQVEEIARLFRVPLHLLQHLERATNNNIEHQSIDFVVHTIRPWLTRWEQVTNTKLFSEEEQAEFFAEFLVEGLLRGDAKARGEFYRTMFNMGAYSPNDIREKENENPAPGGDTYYVPSNMVPSDMAQGFWQGKKPSEVQKEGGDNGDGSEGSA